MRRMSKIMLVAVTVILLAGCEQQRANSPAPTGRIIGIAPIQVGPLGDGNPTASTRWPDRLAERFAASARKAEVGLQLGGLAGVPAAGDPAWDAVPPPQLPAGVAAVALITITDLRRLGDGIDRAQAVQDWRSAAKLVIRDRSGKVVYQATAPGEAGFAPSPKLMGPDEQPASFAAYEACSEVLARFLKSLALRSQGPDSGWTTPPPVAPILVAPAAAKTVSQVIESDPPGADVLVDGKFRGNTPLTIELPAQEVKLRIELSGRQAWERTVVPAADLRLRPLLQPVAPIPPTPPTPAP